MIKWETHACVSNSYSTISRKFASGFESLVPRLICILWDSLCVKKLAITLYSIPQIFDRTIFFKHSCPYLEVLFGYSSRFIANREIEFIRVFFIPHWKFFTFREGLVYCGRWSGQLLLLLQCPASNTPWLITTNSSPEPDPAHWFPFFSTVCSVNNSTGLSLAASTAQTHFPWACLSLPVHSLSEGPCRNPSIGSVTSRSSRFDMSFCSHALPANTPISIHLSPLPTFPSL